jgi:tRNA (guanine-N7-)-methyltransferase
MSVRSARRLSLDQLAPYLLEVPEPPQALNWTAVFGNERPVELEIGFGKGLFLLTAARAEPQTSFVGVEIARKYQLFTATRLAKHGVGNVRLAKADARQFLRDWVPVASVQAIHVYFPDPWWKKRHLKRRVFSPDFAARCEQVLVPGGRLHLATDVGEYFAVMTALVAEQTGLQPMALPPPREAEHDLDYQTNFERKFRKQGKSIHRATYQRPVGSS